MIKCKVVTEPLVLWRSSLNRVEAVEMLKEVLETGNICCSMYSLDAVNDSANYKVSIWANDMTMPKVKKLVLYSGLIVNEEMGKIVIS
jgi:hypothetical protein